MPSSSWAPLRRPLFRSLWLAAVASNVGTWMQNVGAVWLMTSLTPSPLMVALVQTATSLPVFLLALPAGALADIVDRRRLLIAAQSAMLVASAALGVLTVAGRVTPWTLLGLTFVIGAGSAMNGPAWQAIMPELVPRAELTAAIALNGVAVNVARAVGPALGGLVIAVAGTGPVFLLNAASFVGVIAVLGRWRRVARATTLPPEHVAGAIRAGLRYARHAPALHAVLVRGGLFVFCASALWALLPVVARQRLAVGSTGYGVLLGCLGVGAIAGAAILPRLTAQLSIDAMVAAGTLAFAAVTCALAIATNVVSLCAALVVGGLAWLAVMASLNVAAQTTAAAWVQARALALYLLVFQGGLAAGSTVWGAVAARSGAPVALAAAAGGLAVGLAAIARWRLAPGQTLDLRPSAHIPEPSVVVEPPHEDGPVLVTIEYAIDPARAEEFTRTMREMSRVRRRDGATRWELFFDPAEPGRYLECFLVESWVEHLRQHQRATMADREAWDRTRAFQVGDAPPRASHFVAALGDGER
jgi:MFS family permease